MPDFLYPLFRLVLLLLGFGMGFSGCSTAEPQDSWIRYRTPQESIGSAWGEVPSTRIHRVEENAISKATAMLAGQPVRELAMRDVRELLGRDLPPESSQKVFLLRAVKIVANNGRFVVLTSATSVVVTYMALTNRERNDITREPILVELPGQPAQLYVELSLAE